jgi:threonine dehydrogenase-like Zn-dependent dehydrogenase
MKLAQIIGAKVIAIDVNQGRLDYAKDKIGLDHVVLAGEGAVEKVMDITNNDLATAVFDASGHKGALEFGHNFMSHGGRYVLVGLSKGKIVFEHPTIHAKETTLMCSRNATLEDFEHIISILEDGKFPIDSFITHNVDFVDMIANFDRWLDPKNGVIKATVNF